MSDEFDDNYYYDDSIDDFDDNKAAEEYYDDSYEQDNRDPRDEGQNEAESINSPLRALIGLWFLGFFGDGKLK